MRERNQEPAIGDPLDDIFDPALDEISENDLEESTPIASNKKRLAEQRRRAELRLDEKRLRDELGDYDLEFDDL
ncbi:MAG: hypothetical protein ACJAYC_003119 [Halieaceae bacterium]|jgi:hypothetical protein